MKNEKRLFLVLALVQFAHIIDFIIIMPLGSQFMRSFDISPQQFSLIVSSYAISAFFMGIFSALFIDRFDRKKALLVLFIGFTLGTLACAIAPGYYSFLVARSLTGAFGGILSALVLAIVGDAVPLERRGQAMGIIMTAFSVASVVGVPAGLFIAAKFGLRMPFIAVTVLSGFTLIMIQRYIPSLTKHLETGQTQNSPTKVIMNIVGDSNQLKALLFTIILMLGHFTIIPFIAPYMQQNIGFSNYDISFIYLFGGIATAILLPLVGRIADKYGHIKVFTISTFFALFSIFAITNLDVNSIAIALCVTTSYFIASSGRSVPATTMVTSVVKPESRGSFMSIRSSANELALALGSLIAGVIVIENPDGSLANYQYVGYIAIFMSIVAVLIGRTLKLVD